MSISFDIKTFGCKVNTYDTALLQKRLQNSGYLMTEGTPQIHILNTCAVTREATNEAIKEINRIKKKNPQSVVVVTGCAAQVDTGSFENVPADLVIANSHKGLLETLIKQHLNGELTQKVFHSNIFRKADLEENGGVEAEHTRAFLKIQDGCNSFCTFCVIPFARGKSRSLSIPHLVEKINEFTAQGLNEVVLTGVHIGDYESDDGKIFDDLIEAVLAQTKMPRIRLSSLEPIEISDRLLEMYSDDRMCPHFHMSIQSANTKVLADMKRKYTAEHVEDSLNRILRKFQDRKLKAPFIGMDVIAGFPGETEEEFNDTYERLKRTPWTRMHVFPYSERPGTKALNIDPKVPNHLIHARAERLRQLSAERYSMMALEQIGEIKKVLVLKSKAKGASTLSRDYWPVDVEISSEAQIGTEISVKIVGYDQSNQSRIDGFLKGSL
ncbi:MAG: tRNA (N(6)-L-threonylcarbamoyladenosine(37)-C(2))-methylthiotransferase MtaB [Bdellovibrionota bacterium]